MAFDYKKEYKALYQPPREPQFVTVPAMTFAAVRGQGDPNDPTGEYKAAIELLYGLLYTIKMSKKGSHRVDGYFDFVVPPLEGLWEQTGTGKESFHWTSMLRLPEFVTREEFDWAVREATAKKKKPLSGGRKRGMDMKLPEKKQRWVYHAEALPQAAGEGVTRRVLAYTDGLVGDHGRVPDAVFTELQRHLNDEEIVEFTYITAWYAMHADISKALRLEWDDVADPVAEMDGGDGAVDVIEPGFGGGRFRRHSPTLGTPAPQTEADASASETPGS